MNSIIRTFVMTSTLAVIATGCSSSKNGWLQTADEKPIIHTDNAGGRAVEISQTATMVIVGDDSTSMAPHYKDTVAQFDRFSSAAGDGVPVEMHIAITTVYDGHTFDPKPKNKCEYDSAQKEMISKGGPFVRRGEFRQIIGEDGKPIPNKFWISSKDANWKTLLKNTLDIKVKDWKLGGPQYEESFSPIADIYGLIPPPPCAKPADLAEVAAQRQGFLFGAGSSNYNFFFFFTDAPDRYSPISADKLHEKLLTYVGNDDSKLIAYGALVPSTIEDGDKSCPRDPGGKPIEIERFLELTNPKKSQPGYNELSLCDKFGDKLASFGSTIREKVFAQRIKVPSANAPIISDDDRSLRVTYGDVEIPRETKPGVIGFKYEPTRDGNYIVLNSKLQLPVEPGAQFQLHFTEISPNDISNGHVAPYGVRQGLENQ